MSQAEQYQAFETVRLPNLTRAAFCEYVLHLARRFDLEYAADEDSLYQLCEAIAIGLFTSGEPSSRHQQLVTFINARGFVQFRGE